MHRLALVFILALPLATLPAVAGDDAGLVAPRTVDAVQDEVSIRSALSDAAAQTTAQASSDLEISALDAPTDVRVIVGAGPFEQAASLAHTDSVASVADDLAAPVQLQLRLIVRD